MQPTFYPVDSSSFFECYLPILGRLALSVKGMAAMLDSAPPSPSPEQEQESKYRNTKPPPNAGKRASKLSQSSFVHRSRRRCDSDVRRWEAELAGFRTSWNDEFVLFDGCSWGQIEGEIEAQENSVDWDGPDDAANPLTWSAGRKWAHVITLSTITMIRQPSSSSHSAQTPSIHC